MADAVYICPLLVLCTAATNARAVLFVSAVQDTRFCSEPTGSVLANQADTCPSNVKHCCTTEES
jgi:hypothetical protein